MLIKKLFKLIIKMIKNTYKYIKIYKFKILMLKIKKIFNNLTI